MTIASNLGFPRIGHRRELKLALERFWSGELDENTLNAAGTALRMRHWKLQVEQASAMSRPATSRSTTMCSIRRACWG
jgi:Cobalamin-independent synthase, N-terminal domain